METNLQMSQTIGFSMGVGAFPPPDRIQFMPIDKIRLHCPWIVTIYRAVKDSEAV